MKTNHQILTLAILHLGLFASYGNKEDTIIKTQPANVVSGLEEKLDCKKGAEVFDSILITNVKIEKLEESSVNKIMQQKITFPKIETGLLQQAISTYAAQQKILRNKEDVIENFAPIDALLSFVNANSNRQNNMVRITRANVRQKKHSKRTLGQNRKMQAAIFVITIGILFPLLYLFGASRKMT